MARFKILKLFLITLFKRLRYFYYQPAKPQYLIKNVPYYSQFASPDLVEDFINENKSSLNDPRWKESGARTKAEYQIWAWNGCGMACTQMLLKSITGKTIPLVKLGKKCLTFGGYSLNSRARKMKNFRDYYHGLFYIPYLKFLKSEFKLKGKSVSHMILKEIIKTVSEGSFVIASVNPEIRNPQKDPKSTGRHLVLVFGYNMDAGTLILNNPSGIYGKSQENVEISFSDFNKFFANRGIVVYK